MTVPNFDVVKPKIMNPLFRRMGKTNRTAASFIGTLYKQGMQRLKWQLSDNYVEKRMDALRLLPVNKRQYATIKGQITKSFNKKKAELAAYEKKFGKIKPEVPATEYKNYEADWLKTKKK